MAMFSALYTFNNTVFKKWVVINNAYYVKIIHICFVKTNKKYVSMNIQQSRRMCSTVIVVCHTPVVVRR